jgi:hypothetical protein
VQRFEALRITNFEKGKMNMKQLAILSVLFAMTSSIVLADDCDTGSDQTSTTQQSTKTENKDPSKILVKE